MWADVITYNTVILAYRDSSQWRRGVSTCMDMRRQAFEPDVVTYTMLIDMSGSCGSSGSTLDPWQQALALLRHMQAGSICPNALSYDGVASLCALGLHWHLAVRVLSEQSASGKDLTTSSESAWPTVVWACEASGVPAP